MKNYFGNLCYLEGISHEPEGNNKIRSKLYLHTQAASHTEKGSEEKDLL